MSDDSFWVGARADSGAMWVYDPEIAHDDDSMVYAFWVSQHQMRPYPKAQIKSSLVTVRDSRRQKAIDSYVQWKAANAATF